MSIAVIAKDGPLLPAGLEEDLLRHWPGRSIVAEAEDGVDALEALGRGKPPKVVALERIHG